LCRAHYYRWRKHGDPTGGGTAWGEPDRFYRDVVLPYCGDECLLWPYSRTAGYGRLCREGRDYLVSRLVCEDEHGPAPTEAHEAAHSCGNGKLGCVTRKHLSWKTRVENEADKLVHGTHNRGERQGGAKLTTDDVLAIRALVGQVSQKEIASRFGIGKAQVSRIVNGKTWSWLLNERSHHV
jgi:hypothetical protein